MHNRTVAIVGGGPVGALVALYLARRGIRSSIYEKRSDPRTLAKSEGRSINLALSRRGFDALEPVGLASKVMEMATPMLGRRMHAVDGKLSFQPYGKLKDEVIYAVSRGALNNTLLNAVHVRDEITVHFDEKCIDADVKEGTLTFEKRDGKQHLVTADTILACDGVGSVVRRAMTQLPRFDVDQQHIEYGYKELLFQSGHGGTYLMDQNALHIWPRGGYMLIALPNSDGTFTGTLFFPWEGEPSFASLNTPAKVAKFFETQFADAIPLIPDYVNTFLSSLSGTLQSVRCSPWFVQDKVLLLGDAAHGIVPFLGQGLNCAFEGVSLLMECFDKSAGRWTEAFATFQKLRKPDTDAIAEMALENFVEMRDRVADTHFLLRKRVELELETRFFPRFIGRYGMIQFHHTPYARAQSIGQVNEYILSELTADIHSLDEVDWNKAKQLVTEML